jgi:hypothetical protein
MSPTTCSKGHDMYIDAWTLYVLAKSTRINRPRYRPHRRHERQQAFTALPNRDDDAGGPFPTLDKYETSDRIRVADTVGLQ